MNYGQVLEEAKKEKQIGRTIHLHQAQDKTSARFLLGAFILFSILGSILFATIFNLGREYERNHYQQNDSTQITSNLWSLE